MEKNLLHFNEPKETKISLFCCYIYLFVLEMHEEAIEPVKDAGAMAVLLADSRSLSAKTCAAESAESDAPQDISPMLAVPPPTWLDSV